MWSIAYGLHLGCRRVFRDTTIYQLPKSPNRVGWMIITGLLFVGVTALVKLAVPAFLPPNPRFCDMFWACFSDPHDPRDAALVG